MEFDKDKIKLKIAMSKMKDENKTSLNNHNMIKVLSTLLLGTTLCTGTAFAAVNVYEKIFGTPQKVNVVLDENNNISINDEQKDKNITENEAKQIAVEVLNRFKMKSEIINVELKRELGSDKIIYLFDTIENYSINIDGLNGTFIGLYNNNDIRNQNEKISKTEAIDLANNYVEQYLNNKNEFDIVNVWCNNDDELNKEKGYRFDITYNRKYGEKYNPYESITISIESGNKGLAKFVVENVKFDNNEIVLTKEEACQIALNEDSKINVGKIINKDITIDIVKTNTVAYERTINADKFYDSLCNTDNYIYKDFYTTDNKVRNAYIVSFEYETVSDNESIIEEELKSQFSYFVDATTGEIIGGRIANNVVDDNNK